MKKKFIARNEQPQRPQQVGAQDRAQLIKKLKDRASRAGTRRTSAREQPNSGAAAGGAHSSPAPPPLQRLPAGASPPTRGDDCAAWDARTWRASASPPAARAGAQACAATWRPRRHCAARGDAQPRLAGACGKPRGAASAGRTRRSARRWRSTAATRACRHSGEARRRAPTTRRCSRPASRSQCVRPSSSEDGR